MKKKKSQISKFRLVCFFLSLYMDKVSIVRVCLMENNQKNNNKGRKNFIIYRSVYQGKIGEKLEKEKKYLSSVCIWEGVCQCVIIAFTNRPYIFESKAHIQEEMWWVTSIYVCLSLRSHSHNTIHLCVCVK